MATRPSDPLVAFAFRLDMSGAAVGYFTECSGLGSENDVIRQKIVDQGGQELEQVIPGRLKWTDITLKRGVTANMDLWDWRELVVQGNMQDSRLAVSLHLLDREYQEVAEWTLERAWPSKMSGPSLKADSNELGIEEVTIVHEGMIRVT